MRIAVGLIVLAAALGVAQAGETGWPSVSTGRYPDADPPVTFSPTENVVWAAPMPSWSNACPVVIEDRIFVCAEPDILIAVEKKKGKVLWQRANPVSETSNAERSRSCKKCTSKARAWAGWAAASAPADFSNFWSAEYQRPPLRSGLHSRRSMRMLRRRFPRENGG